MRSVLTGSVILFMVVGCVVEGPDVGSTEAEMTFDEFLAQVYQEPDTGLYIINGDEPARDMDELRAFYARMYDDGALIVDQVNGGDNVWDATERLNITYCVSQSSFGSNYSRVVDGLNQATAAWEGVANVNFVHVTSADGSCTNRTGGLVFNVREVAGGQYLASAFFPDYPRRYRELKIDPSAYYYEDLGPGNPNYISFVGVLRHELGHTIGFRHEHTRPESGVCFEDNNWRALTPYDSASVMHYPQCNGTGDWLLELTAMDVAGAVALYGEPGAEPPPPPPPPPGECTAAGDSCSSNSDCCSNKCHKKFNFCQ